MKSIPTLNQKIERLKSNKRRLEYTLKKNDNRERKSRTRTLIQIGGLLNITPLLDHAEITLGDDLESTPENKDKAAILLGMFQHLVESLPPQISPNQKDEFKQKGIALMKMRSYQKIQEYQK